MVPYFRVCRHRESVRAACGCRASLRGRRLCCCHVLLSTAMRHEGGCPAVAQYLQGSGYRPLHDVYRAGRSVTGWLGKVSRVPGPQCTEPQRSSPLLPRRVPRRPSPAAHPSLPRVGHSWNRCEHRVELSPNEACLRVPLPFAELEPQSHPCGGTEAPAEQSIKLLNCRSLHRCSHVTGSVLSGCPLLPPFRRELLLLLLGNRCRSRISTL